MNYTTHILVFIIYGISTAISIAENDFPEDREPLLTALTVKVIDEAGDPIGPVDLHFSYLDSTHPNSDGGPYWNNVVKSNDSGVVQVTEVTHGMIRVGVKADGFYPSSKIFKWDVHANWNQIQAEQRMIPWNPIMTITLKKVGDVAPMLVISDFRKLLPGLNAEYAMDIMEADWLPPHGKGKVADCYFSVLGDETSSKMVIRFPNVGDGMIPVQPGVGIESQLRSPREAPAEGFQNLIEINTAYDSHMRRPSYEEAHATGFIFRIRTPKDGKTDDAGPLHGKMMNFHGFAGIANRGGDINSRFEGVRLYLNPVPGDRRIEADMTKNLRPDEWLPTHP